MSISTRIVKSTTDWRHASADYFARIDGQPLSVVIEHDDDEDHTSVQVGGLCPDCGDASEFDLENPAPETVLLTCVCGRFWLLESGIPPEFKGPEVRHVAQAGERPANLTAPSTPGELGYGSPAQNEHTGHSSVSAGAGPIK